MQYRIHLPEKDLPRKWYNPLPDLPTPLAPPLDPATHEPLTPEMLSAIFPISLIEQEMSPERWIAIPEPVLDIYRLWRPTPLVRAYRLEQAIGTQAKIYYKNESVSPAGSHKPNTAVPQAFYNKQAGITRLATETGAGQWGTALSFATKMLGLACTVYMVKISFEQKPYRGILIRSFGGEIYASPSEQTESGRTALAEDPGNMGSLGLAISEAVEDAANRPDTNYALGSVLNHVILHQTITGLETKEQLASIGEKPDVLIGCVGGGSNFGGFVAPFLPEKLGGAAIRFLGVEPQACPTLTRGEFRYDYGDVACLTPLLKMHTLGHGFKPAPIHAGGLRYHGGSPIVCNMVKEGLAEAKAYYQRDVFEAARTFMFSEGFLPAPETSHAIKAAIDEAKDAEPGKVICFLFSGHGMLDLASYEAFLQGKLTNYAFSDEDIQQSLSTLPVVDDHS